jgi:ATP P2X receptor
MSTRLQLRDIFDQDLDKLFSYNTPMLVLINDKYLGLMKNFINLIILLYFFVYVIILKQAYIQKEDSVGTAMIYATGTAISLNNSEVRIWDSVDIAYPQHDPSAVVISTNVTEQIRQQKGLCTDETRPCSNDTDCISPGTCTSGYCNEPSWCSNYTKNSYLLYGVENMIIWFQGNVRFLTMAPNAKFTTLDKSTPVTEQHKENSYLLSDLLDMGGMNYDDIKDTGASIKIKLNWQCHITFSNKCSPTIKVFRLDDAAGASLGFYYNRYIYYKDNSQDYRDWQNVTGIKLVVESSGTAYAITVASIILNISSAINLTMITPKIVDFIMLNCMKSRKKYRASKYNIVDLEKQEEEENKSDNISVNELQEINPDENQEGSPREENDSIRNIP